MELWAHKLLAIMCIFLACLVCLMLPIPLHKKLLHNSRYGVVIISSLMCFGGGTFLGVYMLHMAPDALELIHASILVPLDINYPLAEVIIGLGFLMMLLVEITVMRCNKPKKSIKDNQQKGYIPVMVKSASVEPLEVTVKNGRVSNSMSANHLSVNSAENGFSRSRPVSTEVIVSPHLHGSHHILALESTATSQSLEDLHLEHADLDLSSTRSMLLLMALSLHHVFEGISVGLKGSSSSVWTLVVAVLSHEIIISFSLGLQLVHAHRSRSRVIILGTLCSLMTPVGVAVGIGVTESGSFASAQTIDQVNGLLQAVSTGVFLYVTFFEILHGEVNHKDATYMKLFFISLGYGMMCLLSLLPEDKSLDIIVANATLATNGFGGEHLNGHP